MILIAIFLPTLLGFLILAMVFRDEQGTGLLERISLAFPLGAGVLTMQMFVLGLFRVPLTLGHIGIPLVVEIALLSFWTIKKKVAFSPRCEWGLRDDITSSKNPLMKKVALVLLIVWIGAKLLSVFVKTDLMPIYAWDSWANWSTGAKLFYFTKGLLLDAPPEDFFSGGAVLRITSYPLHNPLMQVWMSLWTGAFDEVLVKFWSPVYLLAMTVSLYLIASRELGRLAALALVVMFLSSPLLSYHATEVYSDLPLSVYLFLASVSFLNAMRGRHSYWFLLGLFSAEAMFTKDEALFFVAPLLLSAFIFVWQTSDVAARRWQAVRAIVGPVLLVVPWYLFKFSHALGLGVNNIRFEFTFHPEIIKSVVMQVLTLANFNIFFIFPVILLIIGGKPSLEILSLFAATACYALFFIMLYMFTTFYYLHFSQGTIFNRNLLTYYPVVALLTVLLLKRIGLRSVTIVQEH
jgi:hypothetical protein